MKKQYRNVLLAGAGVASGAIAVRTITRGAINRTHDSALKIIMNDMYDENIWELVSAATRLGLQEIVETNLRSAEGKKIGRPLGSPKKFPSLDDLMFSIAQLHTMPTQLDEKIDLRVTIGKKAKKPFVVDIPILIAPMAYGVALSKKAKVALAQGAALAGTSTNTGEGPFLPEERKAAKYLIYQYHRGDWDKTPEIIRQCNAVEIQIGQGAIAGVGHLMQAREIDKELRKAFKYPKNKDAVAHSRQPEVNRPEDLKKLVQKLKYIGEGIPIGIKMGAGKHLEADLEWICDAGIDFISLEGAEAATKASAPILQDDFGVPMVFAINRAANWLEKNHFKDRVSLIASGKMRNPGDVLKACALGADACYMGSVALFAMTHKQVLKALPFEPPTQVLWHTGKFKKKFKVSEGTKNLYFFLRSCKEELAEGVKALGKTDLQSVDRNDLFAISELVGKGCNLPMAYEPWGG
jgi:glutamate synthase domain-containing protein 2